MNYYLQCTQLNQKIMAASWSELGRVNIFDLSQQLQAVDNDLVHAKYNKENIGNTVKPLFTFSGHQQEGFAIDWCSTFEGVGRFGCIQLALILLADCIREVSTLF